MAHPSSPSRADSKLPFEYAQHVQLAEADSMELPPSSAAPMEPPPPPSSVPLPLPSMQRDPSSFAGYAWAAQQGDRGGHVNDMLLGETNPPSMERTPSRPSPAASNALGPMPALRGDSNMEDVGRPFPTGSSAYNGPGVSMFEDPLVRQLSGGMSGLSLGGRDLFLNRNSSIEQPVRKLQRLMSQDTAGAGLLFNTSSLEASLNRPSLQRHQSHLSSCLFLTHQHSAAQLDFPPVPIGTDSAMMVDYMRPSNSWGEQGFAVPPRPSSAPPPEGAAEGEGENGGHDLSMIGEPGEALLDKLPVENTLDDRKLFGPMGAYMGSVGLPGGASQRSSTASMAPPPPSLTMSFDSHPQPPAAVPLVPQEADVKAEIYSPYGGMGRVPPNTPIPGPYEGGSPRDGFQPMVKLERGEIMSDDRSSQDSDNDGSGTGSATTQQAPYHHHQQLQQLYPPYTGVSYQPLPSPTSYYQLTTVGGAGGPVYGETDGNGGMAAPPIVEAPLEMLTLDDLPLSAQRVVPQYHDGITFSLGDAGRELLRNYIKATRRHGVEKRVHQNTPIIELLRLAVDCELWPVAVRLHLEYKGYIPLSPHHAEMRHFRAQRRRNKTRQVREPAAVITRSPSGTTRETIEYEEGIALKLGGEGRKALLKRLREFHELNKDFMDQTLLDHGLKYGEMRNATLPQLFKMAYICGLWEEAVQLHLDHMRRCAERANPHQQRGAGGAGGGGGDHQQHSLLPSSPIPQAELSPPGFGAGLSPQPGPLFASPLPPASPPGFAEGLMPPEFGGSGPLVNRGGVATIGSPAFGPQPHEFVAGVRSPQRRRAMTAHRGVLRGGNLAISSPPTVNQEANQGGWGLGMGVGVGVGVDGVGGWGNKRKQESMHEMGSTYPWVKEEPGVPSLLSQSMPLPQSVAAPSPDHLPQPQQQQPPEAPASPFSQLATSTPPQVNLAPQQMRFMEQLAMQMKMSSQQQQQQGISTTTAGYRPPAHGQPQPQAPQQAPLSPQYAGHGGMGFALGTAPQGDTEGAMDDDEQHEG
ncbi:unnamed protein product [Vitrella brassicaformis CCMP3155]|uniref:Uncharacterized protein n=5 Tax=Vitrella brassicaformis TaxID=1169539 RepID=A0A0G4ENL3_VITBC|nr:unnamed protein product [Vitrella brassicaformis CCMP3155]|eukprot:CEL98447.1 unnamed protein product [Vitrella brassicaformis CCMP3155]